MRMMVFTAMGIAVVPVIGVAIGASILISSRPQVPAAAIVPTLDTRAPTPTAVSGEPLGRRAVLTESELLAELEEAGLLGDLPESRHPAPTTTSRPLLTPIAVLPAVGASTR